MSGAKNSECATIAAILHGLGLERFPVHDHGRSNYYQEYEISAYCIGAPHCVVPFEKIKDLMYPSSLDLITR